MKSIAGVDLHAYNYEGDDVIRELKKSGELREIIARSIQLAD